MWTRLDHMSVIVYPTTHCNQMDLAAFLVRVLNYTKEITTISTVFVGLPFTLTLVNSSPRVEGSTVSIDFASSAPLQSATCFLGREFMEDCKLYMGVLVLCLC